MSKCHAHFITDTFGKNNETSFAQRSPTQPHLREFGLQTIRHLYPCVRSPLAVPAALLSGTPGFQVAQTLRFQWFMVLPPYRFAIGAPLHKN